MAEHWVWGIDCCTDRRCMCVSVIIFFNTVSSNLWSLPFTYRENAFNWNYLQNSFPGMFKTEKELLSLHKRFNIRYSPWLMFEQHTVQSMPDVRATYSTVHAWCSSNIRYSPCLMFKQHTVQSLSDVQATYGTVHVWCSSCQFSL